jgi:choline dehydrogenase-like flavoprotein
LHTPAQDHSLKKTVAIVGSGIVGTTIAYLLSRRGYKVDVFEKGPDYPHPHTKQFSERILYLYDNPIYKLSRDLKNHSKSGDYRPDIERERGMRVGGSATYWTGITLRMIPNDFKTKTLYGYGEDWPLTYDELEPYYCRAERLLGVSGTDSDNPFAPWRSQPHPLPPFELSYDDQVLAERLKQNGIVFHTTPQARTRHAYDGRDGCANFGTCDICPMGARYSPNHHMSRAVETGQCRVQSNVTVRRIVSDHAGKARALVYCSNDDGIDREHPADIIVIAAGAIESARLLLLCQDNRNPDGLGNVSGKLGKQFTFHHLWSGRLQYRENLYPGRIGALTGQCHQFLEPANRGKHGAVKVEFSSVLGVQKKEMKDLSAQEIVKHMKRNLNSRHITLHSESIASPRKYVTLSEKRDRFGDSFAHVSYENSDFDYETYHFARTLFEQFQRATEAEEISFDGMDNYDSGAHHMGGCAMGTDVHDSVVDEYGRLHTSPRLCVLGGSNFATCSGAVNPTLTMTALAIRSADYMLEQLL